MGGAAKVYAVAEHEDEEKAAAAAASFSIRANGVSHADADPAPVVQEGNSSVDVGRARTSAVATNSFKPDIKKRSRLPFSEHRMSEYIQNIRRRSTKAVTGVAGPVRDHTDFVAQIHQRFVALANPQTIAESLVLFELLYLMISVPFRTGFLFNPHVISGASPHVSRFGWTTSLTFFCCMDVLVDLIGAVHFYRVYRATMRAIVAKKQQEQRKVMQQMRQANNNIIKQSRRPSEWLAKQGNRPNRRSSLGAQWTIKSLSEAADDADKWAITSQTEFTLEVVALLPIELVPLCFNYNLLHLVRITKTLRLYRVKIMFNKLISYLFDRRMMQRISQTGMSNLMALVMMGMVLSHWFACGYMLVAHVKCGIVLDRCDPQDTMASWAIKDRLVGGTTSRKYARAIYWAARTLVLLGYSDVTPTTNFETLYVICVQVVGALLSTAILATFLFIFRYRSLRESAFTGHVDTAKEYMKSQGIPHDVRRKVMSFFKYTWETHHSLQSDDALEILPRHLHGRMDFVLKTIRLLQVCFLAKEEPAFVNTLASALDRRMYSPKDVITAEKMNDRMFFVDRGIVTIIGASGDRECQPGDFFAEVSLLFPEKYDEKAVAKTFCELFGLRKNQLDQTIVRFYPKQVADVRARMEDVWNKHSSRMKKTNKLLGLTSNTNSNQEALSRNPWIAWRLPGSKFRIRWDLLRLFLIIYVVFEVPYTIAFVQNRDVEIHFRVVPNPKGAFNAFNLLVELFFLVDMVLRMRFFAYVDSVVQLFVVDRSLIFEFYRRKGMVLDLLSNVPIALVLDFVVVGSTNTTWSYAWYFRLLRLLRVRALFELIQDLVDDFGISSKYSLISRLVLSVMFILHIMGCLWFEFAWSPFQADPVLHDHDCLASFDSSTSWSHASLNGSSSDSGALGAGSFLGSGSSMRNSVDHPTLTRETCLQMATQFANCSWIFYDCYGNVGACFPSQHAESLYTTMFAYLRTFYWAVVALTGVGYGDIVAFGTSESYFAALWIFIGGIINFGVVGAMSSTISNLLAADHEHVERLNEMNHVMEIFRISQNVRTEVHHYYQYQFQNRHKAYESKLLSHLPEQLCHQISMLLHSKATKSVSLFEVCSKGFLEEITGKFRRHTYQSGETICFQGDSCLEFIVISEGRVNMFVDRRPTPVGSLVDGESYGVNEFMVKATHSATLITVSTVEASVMQREQFDSVVFKYKSDLRNLRMLAKVNLRQDLLLNQTILTNFTRTKLRPHVLATLSIFPVKDEWKLLQRRRNFKSLWNIVVTFFNLFNAFQIVFRIAFHAHLPVTMVHFWFATRLVDVICDGLFGLDILLKCTYFNLGTSSSAMEDIVGLDNLVRWKQVNRNYFRKVGFYRDLFASLPLYYFGHDLLLQSCFRMPRLMRCLELPYYFDAIIIQIQEKFASKNISSYLSPLKLLFYLLLASHYAACGFFLVSERESEWNANSWIHHDHMVHEYHHSLGILYLRSFYWALATLTLVGSSDIVPRSIPGTIWAGITCFLCSFIVGHIIGELSELMLEVDKELKEYKSRVEHFEQFAKSNGLNSTLRARVATFLKFQYMYTRGKSLAEFCDDLSANLRLKLLDEVYGSSVRILPINRFLSSSQVNALALRLKSELFIPGDDILTEDSNGNRLCILKKGFASVLWQESITTVAILLEGCLFGEVAFFLSDQRRTATVKATTSCEVLHISKHAWVDLWKASAGGENDNVNRYSQGSIMSWVGSRVNAYQQSFVKIAICARSIMTERKRDQRKKARNKQPEHNGSHPPSLRHPQQLAKPPTRMLFTRNSSIVSTDVQLLETKARFLLAKAEVYARAARSESYSASGNSTVTRSSIISRGSTGSSREVNVEDPEWGNTFGATNSDGNNTSQAWFNHEELDLEGFFAEVNPLHRQIEMLMSDEQVRALERESWKRYQYASTLQDLIGCQVHKLMEATKPIRRVALRIDSPSKRSSAPHRTAIVKKEARSMVNLNHATKQVWASGDTAQVASPPKMRLLPRQSNPDNKTLQAMNANLTRQFGDGVVTSFNATNSQDSSSAASFRRCQSVPLFNTEYFASIKQEEDLSKKIQAKTTQNALSLFRLPPGIDYDLLQRSKRPKLLVFFRILRRYMRAHGMLSQSSRPSLVSQQTMRRITADKINQKRKKSVVEVFNSMHADEFLKTIRHMRRAWDTVMLLVTVYYSVVLPFKVSFASDLANSLSPSAMRNWMVLEWLFDTLCLVDVVYNLINKSHLDVSLHKLDSKFKRFRLLREQPGFIKDFVAVVPLEFLLWLNNGSYVDNWEKLCYLRCNKFIFTHRILTRFEDLFQYMLYELRWSISEASLGFYLSIWTYLLRGHWIACFWYLTSSLALQRGYVSTSWLTTPDMLMDHHVASQVHDRLLAEQVDQVGSGRKYLRSMHFAVGSITTLFYGDIYSTNLLELGVEITVILLSIYIYGTLVAAQGKRMEVQEREIALFENNLSELQLFLYHNPVPKDFRQQIKQYYANLWQTQHGAGQSETLKSLSPGLQEDIRLVILKELIFRMQVFHSVDMFFLKALMVKLQFLVCSEGEEVVSRGDVDRSMYFISSGLIFVQEARAGYTKDPGQFFGEWALLYGLPRRETCLAVLKSELFCLDNVQYEKLLLDFPEYREKNKLDWTTAERGDAAGMKLYETLHKAGTKHQQQQSQIPAAQSSIMMRMGPHDKQNLIPQIATAWSNLSHVMSTKSAVQDTMTSRMNSFQLSRHSSSSDRQLLQSEEMSARPTGGSARNLLSSNASSLTTNRSSQKSRKSVLGSLKTLQSQQSPRDDGDDDGGGGGKAQDRELTSDNLIELRDAWIESRIPRHFIFVSMMEMLARLQTIDAIETGALMTKARDGTRKLILRQFEQQLAEVSQQLTGGTTLQHTTLMRPLFVPKTELIPRVGSTIPSARKASGAVGTTGATTGTTGTNGTNGTTGATGATTGATGVTPGAPGEPIGAIGPIGTDNTRSGSGKATSARRSYSPTMQLPNRPTGVSFRGSMTSGTGL